jgi:hypothetical protein
MKLKILCISLLFVFFSIPSICFSEPQNTFSSSKDGYEVKKYRELQKYSKLQIQCEKRCKDYIDKTKVVDNWLYVFSHYNNKINKCFMLKTTLLFGEKEGSKSTTEELYDIDEQRPFGTYRDIEGKMIFCSISGKECKSKKEWDELRRPYMTDYSRDRKNDGNSGDITLN